MMIHHVNFLPTPESTSICVIPSTVPLPPARAPFGCDSFFTPTWQTGTTESNMKQIEAVNYVMRVLNSKYWGSHSVLWWFM